MADCNIIIRIKTAILQIVYWLQAQSTMPCEERHSGKAARTKVAEVSDPPTVSFPSPEDECPLSQ